MNPPRAKAPVPDRERLSRPGSPAETFRPSSSRKQLHRGAVARLASLLSISYVLAVTGRRDSVGGGPRAESRRIRMVSGAWMGGNGTRNRPGDRGFPEQGLRTPAGGAFPARASSGPASPADVRPTSVSSVRSSADSCERSWSPSGSLIPVVRARGVRTSVASARATSQAPPASRPAKTTAGSIRQCGRLFGSNTVNPGCFPASKPMRTMGGDTPPSPHRTTLL